MLVDLGFIVVGRSRSCCLQYRRSEERGQRAGTV